MSGVTIIVPTFNAAATLGACLDSIVQQTVLPAELIVMDGLSKDETVTIAQGYAGKFPFIRVVSEKDKGIYDAMNKGIAKAQGEWIYLLGSDDRLAGNEVLEKITPVLAKTKASIVYGSVCVQGDAGWAEDGAIYDGEFPLHKLLQKNICQQAVFYRRTIFDQIGTFNPRYKICADWDFMLHAAAVAPLEYVDQIIADFVGGGASSIRRDPDFENDFLPNLKRYFGKQLRGDAFRKFKWQFRDFSKQQMKQGRLLNAWQFYSAYRTLLRRD